ncbi:MAG TPA: nucleoside 2-deoxyribosyltransferase [Chthoniobacterales bacterium]
MSYSIYFAGELFSAKHLYGNALLAENVFQKSNGRYISVLPQNLEQRETTAQAIRDQDIKTCLACDAGIFHYDGTELDSGTVVEFLFAKFADIPAVLLRTDFRRGGDQGGDPWNLMTSFFPRTDVVMLDAMSLYKEALAGVSGSVSELLSAKAASAAADGVHETVADRIITALDRVIALPPILARDKAAAIYEWLSVLPALGGSQAENTRYMLNQLQAKIERGLL